MLVHVGLSFQQWEKPFSRIVGSSIQQWLKAFSSIDGFILSTMIEPVLENFWFNPSNNERSHPKSWIELVWKYVLKLHFTKHFRLAITHIDQLLSFLILISANFVCG